MSGSPEESIMILVIGTFMIGGVFTLKWTGSRLLSANIIISSFAILLILLSLNDTRPSAPDLINLVFVVLLAFMMTGARFGAFWGSLSLLTIVVVLISRKNGFGIDRDLTGQEFADFIGYIVLVGVTMILTMINEVNSSRNLKNFQTEKKQSERQSQELKSALDAVREVMESTADSNLSRAVEGTFEGELDDLKVSVNSTIKFLSQTMSRVKGVSSGIVTNAGELRQASETLASGNSEQAASIEEISSSMDEIESRTKVNAENASLSQELANQTLQVVEDGNQQMNNMLDSINQINSTSSDVAKVIKVIDEIAFQTNLLALNAAVEAARAGKYGKGFAVVAEEVRNLAGRSAEAAKNTTSLIETSTREVENGVLNAEKTAQVFERISDSISKVNDLMSEVASGSEEQRKGISEINNGLSQINRVVQHNSSVSEETASSAQELSAQVSDLQVMMGKFVLSSDTETSSLRPVITRNIPERRPTREPRLEQIETRPGSPREITLDDKEFGKY